MPKEKKEPGPEDKARFLRTLALAGEAAARACGVRPVALTDQPRAARDSAKAAPT